MKIRLLSILLLLISPALAGFDLDNAVVPKREIRSGGPPKDGIPAILDPKFIPPESASFLQDDEPVIGVEINGEARAYPINILNWHEVVNDEVANTPLVITY